MVKNDARLLPLVEWEGREFLVDVAGREFRNVDDAGDFIDMHSPQGRVIVRQMEGTQWTIHALDTGDQADVTV